MALLGACAVVVAAPASGRAAERGKASAPAKVPSIFDSKPSPGYRDKVVYVLSNTAATGSNVPTVYRVYHGTVNTVGSASRSAYFNLAITGSNDVAGALSRLDPAVTANGGHR